MEFVGLPRPRVLSIPLLLLTVALAGCAPQIRLAQPRIPLPARFETTPVARDSVALDQWWTAFADPQLSELIDAALVRSTDARTAYFRLSEARAIRALRRSQRWPTGNLSGSAKSQEGHQFTGNDPLGQTANATSQSLNFNPSWELDVFGRLAAIGREADATYKAAHYDYHAARMALAADVGSALFEARSLAAQRADAAETLRIANELADTSALGLSHGLVAAADAARLQRDEAAAQAEIERLDTALRNAKRSLLVLIGDARAPTDSLVVEPRLAPPPDLPAAIPSLLLTRRPDILAAEQRLAAATQTVQIDRLALFPSVSLQGASNLTRTSALFGGTTGLWSIAGALSLPILDRPRLMAQLRISEARGQQAVVSYEAAVQAAFRDADNALAAAAADRQRLGNLARAEERARYAFGAARRGYRAGLTDLTTLLQSEQSWRQARSTLIAARAQALTGTIDVYRTLGGGWDAAAYPAPGDLLPHPPSSH